ncbi:DUF6221 family protein [Micromonospora aurantiaca (nom. illeg.)]|uniref:DUF6221 family protein n=1 Tax=Micromonospora aurantiaca (nom. illeg.) TaxID=47850 RepID=UPI003DA4C7D7
MDDLVIWLRQQLDDDEQAAVAAGHASHFYDCSGECFDHHERWDDARVLAEVEAKRRLLRQFELRGNAVRATVQPSTGGVWDDLLRMLALPYADRPGYREQWRP